MEALLSGVEKVMADLEGANTLLFDDGTTTTATTAAGAATPGGGKEAGGEVRVSVAEEIAAETRAADEAIRAVKEREKEREGAQVKG